MDTTPLSEEELNVLMDAHFMPIKQRVSEKIILLLAQLRQELIQQVRPHSSLYPPEINLTSGKISKGENYKTYAYRVLDFPTAFSGESMFLYRSLMLWGHYFGFHLILSGKWKTQFQDALIGHHAKLAAEGVLLSIQESPWECEIEPATSIPLDQLTPIEFQEKVKGMKHLKIGRKLSLKAYEKVPTFGKETWRLFEEGLFGQS